VEGVALGGPSRAVQDRRHVYRLDALVSRNTTVGASYSDHRLRPAGAVAARARQLDVSRVQPQRGHYLNAADAARAEAVADGDTRHAGTSTIASRSSVVKRSPL